MARTLTKNHEHYRQALTRLPLGVASNFRFWGEDRTIYVKQGRGARITDLDGNVYVDYRMGYGPAILGYADPRVDAAATRGHGGGRRVRAVDRARVPRRGADRADGAGGRAGALLQLRHRGGDGGAAAGARLHQAATTTSSSRAAITDCSMRPCGTRPWRSGRRSAIPGRHPYSEGVPLATRSFAHFVQANDANQLEDVLKRHGDSIACLLIEPIMGNCLGIAAEPAYRARGTRAVRPLWRGADHR